MSRSHLRRSTALAALVAAVVAMLAAAPAGAAITPSRSGPTVAAAMTDSLGGGQLAGASFQLLPPETAKPAAVADSSLAGFPTSGSDYAILSSGNVEFADDPDDSGSLGATNGDAAGTEAHGEEVHDMVQLKVDLAVPAAANCLSLDFRFLSEEYPEFIGDQFNDGFVAELDASDFDATALGISAPHNFAFDGSGNVVSVNTTGFAPSEAAGTTYDAATPLLRALTPVTAGAHSVYIAVFDQGDSSYDSAAFIDAVRLSSVPAGSCVAGASADRAAPETTIDSGPAGHTSDSTPTFAFHSSEPGSSFECSIDTGTPAFGPCAIPSPQLADGSYTFRVRAIDGAANTDASPATRTFTVDTVPPDTVITSGPGGITEDATIRFTFHSTEPDSTFECSTDTGSPDFGSCATMSSPLDVDSYTFRVRATDSAGNADPTPATRAFTLVLPPPQYAKTVNLEPVSGKVLVRPKGKKKFSRLRHPEQLKVGATLDARSGRVHLTSAKSKGGRSQSADFYDGTFKVLQPVTGPPITVVRLVSGPDCPTSGKRVATAARSKGNGLWGSGHGNYRSEGRHGAATVRGTIWFTQDTCAGTFFRVSRGVVAVEDFTRDRTVTLRAGSTYLAPAP